MLSSDDCLSFKSGFFWNLMALFYQLIEKKKRKFSKSEEIFGAGRIDCNANNVRKSVRLRPEFFWENMLG